MLELSRRGFHALLCLTGVLFCGFWLLGAVAAKASEEAIVLREGDQWAYAETLFRRQEYFRAITEYLRYQHFFPRGAQHEASFRRVAQAYLLGGEPAQARRWLSERATDALPAAERQYLLALSWLEQAADAPYTLRRENVQRALDLLDDLPPSFVGKAAVDGFLKALDLPPHAVPLPQKSPWLAGAFSAVVPGAGSVYVGRYAEGALAFFLNAVLFYATRDSLRAEQPVAAATFGVLALTFYGGSIYSAVNGAYKFNDDQQAAYLREQRLRFGLVLRF